MKKVILGLLMGFMVAVQLHASAEEDMLNSSNSFKNMLRDSRVIPREILATSQALAIFPSTIEISMLLGGKTGSGVMMVKRDDGTWSYPFFVKLGGAGIGFQVGVEKKDILMVFRSKDSVKKLMDGKITLGADSSVAVGPTGVSSGRGTELDFSSQIYTYTKTKGLFVGVSLDGSILSHDHDKNIEMYGNNITPEQIVESNGLMSSYAIEEIQKTLQLIQQ